MRTTSIRVSGFLLAFVVAACGGSVERTDCNDGIDNDGDDLIDDLDPGCPFNNNVTEAPDPRQCNDTLDNDGDGLIDGADWGCQDAEDDEETDPTRQCNDSVDNDGDGFTDGDDPGCENPVDDDEFNPAACGNQVDDDSDGKIDYPFDPGCESEDDTDETDEGSRACSDGIDNDMDMLVDFGQDPGCTSAADNDEFNTIVGACGPSVVITDISGTGTAMGSIAGPVPNELTSPQCNGYGGESAYTYSVLDGPVSLLVTTDHPETTLDTVVYVRTECRRGDTELGCNDDAPPPRVSTRGSTLILPLVESGTYYIIVDAFSPSSLGDFKLTVEERTPLHGPCDPADPNACVPPLICRSLMPGDPTTCEYHECGDGLDNDGDGVIDFPFEPGCTSDLDDTEVDPSPLPQCANGIDDDGDSFTDYPADPGCDFAADGVELDECYPGKPVDLLDPVSGVTGSTSGATGLTGGTCGGTDSPEDVYALTINVSLASLTLDTDNSTTTFDTILYVRADECATGTEIACNNDIIPFSGGPSSVTFTPTVGTTYFVFVDSQWGGVGSYHIDVSGVINAGEACDPAIPTFTCVSGYACQESAPGLADWTCLVADCNDTIDNDADGFIDWPYDPGCATPSDDAEDFPNPITACSDGVDNDGDTFIDFPDDPGCTHAADNGEIDECVPGAPVIDHPGGTLMGDTSSAPSVLSPPAGCWFDSTPTQELVYVFYHNRSDATLLHFDTQGSTMDTILYIRYMDCSVDGPLAYCNDDDFGFTSTVEITAPAIGYYYAIVDGKWGGVGAFDITIYGRLPNGAPCTVGDPGYLCADGYACNAVSLTCTPSACNDGIDNDADGDIDDFDPGCASLSDNDETDPVPVPACGDGLDNDADGFTDYPADTGCDRAGDDNEMDCAHDMCLTGGTLDPTCDPCVADICAVDPYCCDTAWDSICVGEVESVCGLMCP